MRRTWAKLSGSDAIFQQQARPGQRAGQPVALGDAVNFLRCGHGLWMAGECPGTSQRPSRTLPARAPTSRRKDVCGERGLSHAARTEEARCAAQTPCSCHVGHTLPHVWSFPQVEGTPRRGWLAGPGDTLLAPPTGFTAQHGRPPLRLGHLRPPTPWGRAPDTGCSGSDPWAPDSGRKGLEASHLLAALSTNPSRPDAFPAHCGPGDASEPSALT